MFGNGLNTFKLLRDDIIYIIDKNIRYLVERHESQTRHPN